jgi:hypothetical protein
VIAFKNDDGIFFIVIPDVFDQVPNYDVCILDLLNITSGKVVLSQQFTSLSQISNRIKKVGLMRYHEVAIDESWRAAA